MVVLCRFLLIEDMSFSRAGVIVCVHNATSLLMLAPALKRRFYFKTDIALPLLSLHNIKGLISVVLVYAEMESLATFRRSLSKKIF